MKREDFVIANSGTGKNTENVLSEDSLRSALNKVIQDEHKLFGIEEEVLKEECSQLSAPLLRLFDCYFKFQNKQDYKGHLDNFLKQYNSFLDEFYYCMSGTGKEQQVNFVMAYFWLQTLKQMERRAGDAGDFVARSINIQLQADITFIVHKIYKAN